MPLTPYRSVTIRRPADGHLRGTITLPGSKSETNRALIFGAFHPFAFTIYNFSDSDDSRVFIRFLNAVGIRTTIHDDTQVCIVEGNYRQSTDETVEFDLHHAGTALRFISAFACTLNGKTILTGSDRLSQRPVKPLIDSLLAVGAQIRYLGREGFLPIEVTGDPAFRFMEARLDAELSSQFVSALLLLAPVLPVGARVSFDRNNLASANYAQMTVNLLEALGSVWRWNADGLTLVSRETSQSFFSVESDWSAASYWLGHCAVSNADLTLYNLYSDSLQGDSDQLRLFRKWGLFIEPIEGGLEICNEVGNLVSPIQENFSLMPDLAQTFAVLACFADGESMLTGLHTLPHKETDRIAAVARELHQIGMHVETGSDFLRIVPALCEYAQPIATYNDHRMALSFSLLAHLVDEIEIENPSVVAKSYPTYWSDLRALGFGVELNL